MVAGVWNRVEGDWEIELQTARRFTQSFFKKFTHSFWIQGNAVLLTRMLDNLLSNAVKFTKTKVAIRLVASSAGAVLKVADDGIGIAPDHLSKIWDRFYQVEDSRNKGLNSGIGLGLSFIKDIADLHRAEVKIISEEGRGSLFRVTFPQIKDKTSV